MKLDQRGDIAIAEIVLYIPILLLSIALVVRHGAARKVGWIFFAILSIARIVGGVTHILWEQNSSDTTLQTIFSIMESVGLSPLLMATLAFLSTVGQYTLENRPVMGARTFRILHLVATVAIILAIVGGTSVSSAKKQSDLSNATTFRRVGAILFVILYAGVVAITAFCWLNRGQVLKYRRKLLLAILASLPFLFVRVAFSVLSSFAPLPFGFDADGHMVAVVSSSPLKQFSSTSGSWVIYLVMSVLAEYAVVLIYTFAGVRLPLKQDLADYQKAGMHMRTMSEEALTEHAGARPYDPAYYQA
ncbi:hypothetical protein GSI_11984 [Ganoderma sinense ZZ0214-1]|uniref:DUF7702 domain-containing protein n=1 Tax=Ganoderma sinense ZZ0214-1 TaxID=1077348 RepID=A0A2G8RXI6_9APHY|nr:hypothetical protein GSI_11984 [Ganoderma sinense ZZ0214-1]